MNRMCVINSQRNVCYRSFTNQYKPQSYKNQALLPYSLPYNNEFLENTFNLVIRVLKKGKDCLEPCVNPKKKVAKLPDKSIKILDGEKKRKKKKPQAFFFFF